MILAFYKKVFTIGHEYALLSDTVHIKMNCVLLYVSSVVIIKGKTEL